VYRQAINHEETHGCFTGLDENQRLTILRRKWEDNIKVDTIILGKLVVKMSSGYNWLQY
jgi:hypothetical protein